MCQSTPTGGRSTLEFSPLREPLHCPETGDLTAGSAPELAPDDQAVSLAPAPSGQCTPVKAVARTGPMSRIESLDAWVAASNLVSVVSGLAYADRGLTPFERHVMVTAAPVISEVSAVLYAAFTRTWEGQ